LSSPIRPSLSGRVEGGGYTWSQNSRDNQLTPWSNDPVSDRPGEVLYIRDLDSGDLWTPTALPIRHETASYVVRHGRGYSRFEVVAHGIALELLHTCRFRIPSRSRVSPSATFPAGHGGCRSRPTSNGCSAGARRVGADDRHRARFCDRRDLACNPWNMSHGTQIAFADLGGRQTAWTADRSEFVGRNCTIDNPAALSAAIPLAQRVGAGLDPCAALQTAIELEPRRVTRSSSSSARPTMPLRRRRYRALSCHRSQRRPSRGRRLLDDLLGTLQVTTPDRPMDIMLNGWLLYQTLACRYWARSAFYQASGAYGFRDQLQTSCAHRRPARDSARAHPARAGRQFVQGDFQHWWFLPAGQGVRTRISTTGMARHGRRALCRDHGHLAVLDERVPFIDGPALKPPTTTSISSPPRPTKRRRCSSTAPAASTSRSPPARTACR